MQLLKRIALLVSIVYMTTAHANATCISGNCFNGKGTYLYSDGSKYTGTFLQGKAHGKGTILYRDGHYYEGDFLKGKKHGVGKETFKSKDVYTGEYVNGKIEGRGRMQFYNGDVYFGEWKNESPNGWGKYEFANGDFYEGAFAKGKLNGQGRLTMKDQTYYDGAWVNNKKHGEGTSYTNGKTYIQIYNNGSLISQIEKDSDAVHEAPIAQPTKNNSLPNTTSEIPIKDCTNQYCDNEKGYLTYGDGSVYTGDFVAGQGQGLGECKYANGDRYKGGWSNHAPQGDGIMYFANGNVYSALWENGVPQTRYLYEEPQKEQPKSKPTAQTTKSKADSFKEINVYALVVGIATYNHMQSLKYTDDDAYHFYALLKSPEGGAIPDKNVKILIDDAATTKAIKEELQSLASRADENDVVLLYMSGHGLDGAFVPSDFDGFKGHIPYDDILGILNNSNAKHKLFITDACHSGSMLAQARSPFTVALENFYSAYNSAKSGTAVMMSSKKEEVSLEYGGLRQGVFSHFLIRGMKGEADGNFDKLITVTELYDYVSKNVKSYTSNAQNPAIMGDYDPNMPVGVVR